MEKKNLNKMAIQSFRPHGQKGHKINRRKRQRRHCVMNFTDLVGSAIESRNLRGAFQKAAAAFSQMLGHSGVQSGNAA